MHSLVKFIVRASWCISALAFIISSKTLMAGHSVGGGGTGVACFDTNGRVASIETYDFFFGRKLGRVISLESNSQDYRDIAKVSLDRLAVLSPMRAKTYHDQIALFEHPSESSFLSDSSIFHVPDLGQPALEPGDGCKYVQIIYQQEPRFPKDKRYLVNKFYWDLLPPLQKAGLVLHEVIYREAMSYGHTDSSGAREFNLTFADPDAASMTYRDFVDLLKSIPFIKTDLLGQIVTLGDCHKPVEGHREKCENPNDLKSWISLEFYETGNLKQFLSADGPDSFSVRNFDLIEVGQVRFVKKYGFSGLIIFQDARKPMLSRLTARGPSVAEYNLQFGDKILGTNIFQIEVTDNGGVKVEKRKPNVFGSSPIQDVTGLPLKLGLNNLYKFSFLERANSLRVMDLLSLYIGGVSIGFTVGSVLEVFAEGPNWAYHSPNFPVGYLGSVNSSIQSIEFESSDIKQLITLNEEGRAVSVRVKQASYFSGGRFCPGSYDREKGVFTLSGTLELYPNGQLKSATLLERPNTICFLDAENNSTTLTGDDVPSSVSFTQDGYLVISSPNP